MSNYRVLWVKTMDKFRATMLSKYTHGTEQYCTRRDFLVTDVGYTVFLEQQGQKIVYYGKDDSDIAAMTDNDLVEYGLLIKSRYESFAQRIKKFDSEVTVYLKRVDRYLHQDIHSGDKVKRALGELAFYGHGSDYREGGYEAAKHDLMDVAAEMKRRGIKNDYIQVVIESALDLPF